MKNKLKYLLDIQLFGEGAKDDDTPLSFDEILQDKVYQAEFDRRIQKALDKNAEKIKAEHQKEIDELRKVSELSEEQKKKFDELQEKYVTETKELQEKISNTERNHAIEIAVAKSGTLDPVALKAHISAYVESAEFKDGQIVGLEEHISKRLNEDLKHLTGEIKPTGKEFKTPPKPESTLADAIRSKINGKEDK